MPRSGSDVVSPVKHPGMCGRETPRLCTGGPSTPCCSTSSSFLPLGLISPLHCVHPSFLLGSSPLHCVHPSFLLGASPTPLCSSFLPLGLIPHSTVFILPSSWAHPPLHCVHPSFFLGSPPPSTVNICGQDLTLFLGPQPSVKAFWIRWRLSMDRTGLPAELIPAIGIVGSRLDWWKPTVHRESRMKAAEPFVPALFLQKTVALG